MHLVVVSHGLWGNETHMDKVINGIKMKYPHVEILNLDVNSGQLTYDGIDICGTRAFDRIQVHLEGVEYISFIGYSLGGLIMRFVVGKCHVARLFDRIKPIYFVTLATPHLGTQKPYNLGHVFNTLQDLYLVRVGQQFSVSDKLDHDARPLLVIMADPSHCFYKGLAAFRHRVLFANTQNDRSVRFATAAIAESNPYSKYKKIVIDPEYPSVVTFDSNAALVPRKLEFSDHLQTASRVIIFSALLPVWMIVANTALGIMSVRARIRNANLKADNSWIKPEHDPPDDDPSLYPSINHPTPNGDRAYMIHHLNSLGWTKVHLSIESINAHASMIQRKSFHEASPDVIRYLVDRVMPDMERYK